MERTGLINKVKIILDEYAPAGAGLPFDEYIGPLLDESAREILLEGPLYLLTPVSIPLTSVVYADDKAYIPEPGDFARLFEMKFPLWKRSVRDAISQENARYNVQENEYLKSGYGRPFVALVTKKFGEGSLTRYLECGKCLSSAAPDVALYVKENKPEELAEEFVDALTWRTASKVFLTMGMADRSKVTLEQSMVHLGKLIN